MIFIKSHLKFLSVIHYICSNASSKKKTNRSITHYSVTILNGQCCIYLPWDSVADPQVVVCGLRGCAFEFSYIKSVRVVKQSKEKKNRKKEKKKEIESDVRFYNFCVLTRTLTYAFSLSIFPCQHPHPHPFDLKRNHDQRLYRTTCYTKRLSLAIPYFAFERICAEKIGWIFT